MDTLLGVKGDGYVSLFSAGDTLEHRTHHLFCPTHDSFPFRFVLLAADASAARSILVFKTDQDKILPLDSHKLLASAVSMMTHGGGLMYFTSHPSLYDYRVQMQIVQP